jgi:hypothetical protein
VRLEPLGLDRHWNRYWLLPARALGSSGEPMPFQCTYRLSSCMLQRGCKGLYIFVYFEKQFVSNLGVVGALQGSFSQRGAAAGCNPYTRGHGKARCLSMGIGRSGAQRAMSPQQFEV